MEDNNSRIAQIGISQEIAAVFPDIVIGYLSAEIQNSDTHPSLWNRILERASAIASSMDEESIRQVKGIRSGKQAYRQLGKDPNRYRLSAEGLWRRAAKGKELFSISAAVDVLNLVSLTTGITIGGFDATVVSGDIELGIGRPGEEFLAIGRGPLNVENLPVYRDRKGAIGNPTSDSERTQITLQTSRVLMLITGFYGIEGLDSELSMLEALLTEYCNAQNCQIGIIGNQQK